MAKSVKVKLLRKLCRSALLPSLSKDELALYLYLLLATHPRSLTGTLPWARLSRRLARPQRTLQRIIRKLEQLGFVAFDPSAPTPLLRYRLLHPDQWRAQS